MAVLALGACSGDDDSMKRMRPLLPRLTDAQVKALSGKTFYFAHQSVGYNVVDGVE